MNIKELIKYQLPTFRGIVVADGAAPLEKIIELGASLAWRFSIENAVKFEKVLIAGNIKNKDFNNKGNYFVADIKNIVTIRELVKMNEYEKVIKYQNKFFANWITNQLNTNNNIEPLGVDVRNAIIFENASEIKSFPILNFNFLSNPVTYIV